MIARPLCSSTSADVYMIGEISQNFARIEAVQIAVEQFLDDAWDAHGPVSPGSPDTTSEAEHEVSVYSTSSAVNLCDNGTGTAPACCGASARTWRPRSPSSARCRIPGLPAAHFDPAIHQAPGDAT